MRSSHRDRDDGAREVDLDACAPVAETLDAQMRKIEIDERVKLFEIRNRRPRISLGPSSSDTYHTCRGYHPGARVRVWIRADTVAQEQRSSTAPLDGAACVLRPL